MANLFAGRYDSPASVRLLGCCVTQEDDPWWLVGVLGWLGMYRVIMEAQGKTAEGYKAQLEKEMERKQPGFLYAFHRRWVVAMEREARGK